MSPRSTKAGKAKSAPEVDPQRLRAILKGLDKLYPDAACSLDHQNALQLLVATILSAQCTDERVNKVTPALFERYLSAADFARADPEELMELIRSTGFFRNKAKSIMGMAKGLLEKHGGEVPGKLDDLVKLPGIGRKTANVVLGNAFGVPGITVDTHVGRISRRWEFTAQKDPVKVEFDLMEIIPEKRWTKFCHQVILHGRTLCMAKKPNCPQCLILKQCPHGLESIGNES